MKTDRWTDSSGLKNTFSPEKGKGKYEDKSTHRNEQIFKVTTIL